MSYPFKRLFLLFILSITLSGVAHAQQNVVATLLGKPVTERSVSPTEKQLNALAKTMNVSREMAVAQFQQARLTEIIVDGVLKDYAESKGIEADAELVARFVEVFKDSLDTATPPPEPETEEDKELASAFTPPPKRSVQEIASEQVKHWQVEKAMFEEFGGAVVFRSNTPQYPVGAYNKLLKKYEKEGKLTINAAEFSGVFWRSFAPPYTAEIDPQYVDFSHPWWY